MKTIPKEISWLFFNERVLQEAQNNNNPLYDRIRFLGIYSNNLDEFFRVRVATLKRLAQLGKKAIEILGYNPKTTLNKINTIVLNQHRTFSAIYHNIILELKKKKIFIVNEKQINQTQKKFIENYFIVHVRPLLIPIMLNQIDKLTNLEDDHVYLAVRIIPKEQKEFYAILNLPTSILPRFIQIPSKKSGYYHLMFLDDVIRLGLINIFYQFSPVELEAYTIKITRDAEINITDDIEENYVDKVLKGIQNRKMAEPVRFIYDLEMPDDMLKTLVKKLNIDKKDTIIAGERYHNFKDLLNFPQLPQIEKTKVPLPINHPLLHLKESVIEKTLEKDILLHFPYHSFNHFIDLLREASISPDVKSITITLYRLANPSTVINALINAAKNGKTVTAFMEIQARFDEKNNIHYANELKNEGVKVFLGIPYLKVHAKVCLIEFYKKSKKKNISCFSTGNFNAQTAKVYTDLMLITSNTNLVRESQALFEFMKQSYLQKNFQHLIVSPLNTRQKIEELIYTEIKNAKNKKQAYIDIKINNLADDRIVNLLYKAADAGVKIRLIVRAMCSMTPTKKYKNIEIKAIVDYYLEHSRIFIFCNNNNPKYFISSADLMTRNLDTRVELLCPIYDEALKMQIRHIFDCSWNDNQKARIIDDKLNNEITPIMKSEKPYRSQFEMYSVINNFQH